jgi:hypothetical protein
VKLPPPAHQPAAKPQVAVALSSSTSAELTVSPSTLTAGQQLLTMLTTAQSAQRDPEQLVSLLTVLSDPTTTMVHSTGCWLVNLTGSSLVCCLTEEGRPPLLVNGQLQGVDVAPKAPLSLDMAGRSGEVHKGRFVEDPDEPSASTTTTSSNSSSNGGSSTSSGSSSSTRLLLRTNSGTALQGDGLTSSTVSRRPGQCLYVQVAGQQGVCGPVLLSQRGVNCYGVQAASSSSSSSARRGSSSSSSSR